MLPSKVINFIIPASLILHSIAFTIAIRALAIQSFTGASDKRVTVESWLLPTASTQTTGLIALAFWVIATAGFMLAAMNFMGIILTAEAWRSIAVGAAIISIVGIVLMSGIWPGSDSVPRSMLNTAVALVMNTAILVTQLLLHWP